MAHSNSSSFLPVYICVQDTSQAYEAFCNSNNNNNNNNNAIACGGALLAVAAIDECANAAQGLDEGTLPRENASAILCTGATCSGVVRTARNACSGVDDDVSYRSSTFCLACMHMANI